MTMFKVRWKNEYVVGPSSSCSSSSCCWINTGAPKRNPVGAKCVTETLVGGGKNKEVVLGTNFNFGQLIRSVHPPNIHDAVMRGSTYFKISPYRFVCEASELSRSANCASLARNRSLSSLRSLNSSVACCF